MKENRMDYILSIDDEELFHYLNGRVFAKSGLARKMKICSAVDEALNFLKVLKIEFPDVILVDLNMPDQNGFDFLEEYNRLGYRKKFKDTIVAVLSSSNQEFEKKKVKQYEWVAGYLEKPLTVDVIHKLKRLIQRKKKRHKKSGRDIEV